MLPAPARRRWSRSHQAVEEARQHDSGNRRTARRRRGRDLPRDRHLRAGARHRAGPPGGARQIPPITRRLPAGIDPPVVEKVDPTPRHYVHQRVGQPHDAGITEIPTNRSNSSCGECRRDRPGDTGGWPQAAIQIEIDAEKMNALNLNHQPGVPVSAAPEHRNSQQAASTGERESCAYPRRLTSIDQFRT